MGRTVVVCGKTSSLLSILASLALVVLLQLTPSSARCQTASLIWERIGAPLSCEVWGVFPGIDSRGGVVLFCNGTALRPDSSGHVSALAAQVVSRYRANGTADWSAPYTPFQSGPSIVTMDAAVFDAEDNVYVCGTLYRPTAMGTPDFDIVIRKLDRFGNQLWEDRYSLDAQGSLDTVKGIATDGAGGIFVLGASQVDAARGGMQVLTTIKYDQDGNRLWAQQTGGFGQHVEAVAITADRSGGAYIVGRLLPSDPGGAVAFRYDSSGNLIWSVQPESQTPSANGVEAVAAASDRQGHLYVAVNSRDVFGGVTITKYSQGGELLWSVEKRISRARLSAIAIEVDRSGRILVGGSLHAGRSGYAVVNITSAGHIRDTFILDAQKTETLHPSEMRLDASGNVYMTGLSIPRGGGTREHFTVKFDPSGKVLWRLRAGGSRRTMLDLPRLAVNRNQKVAVSGMSQSSYIDILGRTVRVTLPIIYVFR